MNIAIMQPCYLPWRGYFALMRHADVFVHLDDVSLPQGRSYQTRTAIKSPTGRTWLTLPIRRDSRGRIDEARFADDHWRRKHLATLRQALPNAASIVEDLFSQSWTHVSPFCIAAAERIAAGLGLERPTHRSTELRSGSAGSQHILNLCRELGATRYLTGHGGKEYLEHEAFEQAGIDVMYLEYDLTPYPQPHGPFDPYVTTLDVIERTTDPLSYIAARLVPWREFVLQLA